jgi:hypothetical protein
MEMRGPGRPGKLIREPTSEAESDELSGLPEADNGATEASKGMTGATAGVMGMTTSGELSLNLDDVTVEASPDHCQVNSQAKADTGPAGTSGNGNSDYSASIAEHSLARPCPSECGSGPAVSRVRRSPDAAAIARNARLRSTFVKKYFYRRDDFLILSAYRDQVHPRGPPLSFS